MKRVVRQEMAKAMPQPVLGIYSIEDTDTSWVAGTEIAEDIITATADWKIVGGRWRLYTALAVQSAGRADTFFFRWVLLRLAAGEATPDIDAATQIPLLRQQNKLKAGPGLCGPKWVINGTVAGNLSSGGLQCSGRVPRLQLKNGERLVLVISPIAAIPVTTVSIRRRYLATYAYRVA